MFRQFIKIFLNGFGCVQVEIHIIERGASRTTRGSIELMVLESNHLSISIDVIVDGELLCHLFQKFQRGIKTLQGNIIIINLF